MQIPPRPVGESSRLACLRVLNILDTEPSERFDRLTRVAARLFSVPIALISLLDSNRQWFKSCVGLELRETARDISFCAHAILSPDLLLIPDTLLDERFWDNPMVTGEPFIRFYAGHPLRLGGESLDTLCVIDVIPRVFGPEDRKMLRELAEIAEDEIAALQLATTDELTNLCNRRAFEVLARHTLNICKRMAKPATLLFFDLDEFKDINDIHGHAEGDSALKVFGRGLLTVLRDSDVVGRLGGDEFAALLTGAARKDTESIVARLREWIGAEQKAVGLQGEIRFSVGRSEYDTVACSTVRDLLASADADMYRNKKGSPLKLNAKG